MLLVRPCVEHVLALVRRLQVHMLATGLAVRTSSILAAATSSTVLMCLPAAAAQRRHALCLTEWSSSYYSPHSGCACCRCW